MQDSKYLLLLSVKTYFSIIFCKAKTRIAASAVHTGIREEAGRLWRARAFVAFSGCLEDLGHSYTFTSLSLHYFFFLLHMAGFPLVKLFCLLLVFIAWTYPGIGWKQRSMVSLSSFWFASIKYAWLHYTDSTFPKGGWVKIPFGWEFCLLFSILVTLVHGSTTRCHSKSF